MRYLNEAYQHTGLNGLRHRMAGLSCENIEIDKPRERTLVEDSHLNGASLADRGCCRGRSRGRQEAWRFFCGGRNSGLCGHMMAA